MIQRSIAGLFLAVLLGACGSDQPDGAPVVSGVAYIGASVSDLDRTVALYSQATDLVEVQALDFSGAHALSAVMGQDAATVSTRLMRSVNAQIRYMHFHDASEATVNIEAVGVQGPGIAHVCFQVNKLTKTYDKFVAGGAGTIGATEMQQLSSRNPVEYAYATDLDGIVFEVEHVDVSKLDPETLPENDYRIRHVSLATPDIGRLIKFYSAFLGEKKPRRLGKFFSIGNEAMSLVSGLPDTKVKMAWFQLRNLEIELIQYVSHPPESLAAPRPLDAIGYNMIVFDVTDLAAAQERFVASGGEIVTDVAAIDGGQIVFGRDPDKNLIGLQVPTAGAAVASAQFKNNGT